MGLDVQKEIQEDITIIYDQLEPPRQQKIYNLAERELEEQRYTQDHDDYVGQTAAGAPIEGQQPVPMLGSDTVKLLVNGDSMEDLFYDGDIVEYHPQPERSEEHTSELQSRGHLVCRLLL